jgi:hypothetical protein
MPAKVFLVRSLVACRRGRGVWLSVFLMGSLLTWRPVPGTPIAVQCIASKVIQALLFCCV